MMKEPIGFLGLGSMGACIATRLLDTGHHLVLFDVRAQALKPFAGRNVIVASSPREVADQARIVLASLPTPQVVREATLGTQGLAGGKAIRYYIDLSTTGPETAQDVAGALLEAGIAAVDSPVSGGLPGALAGKLVLMVAGSQEAVSAVTPILENMGQIQLVGERVGMGQSMKLINNVMSATHMAITAELMVLGVKAGLVPETMLNVLNKGSGRNTSTEERFPKFVLPRTFDNGFSNALMRKDVGLCMDMAETLQVPMWVATAVDRLWMQTVLQIGGQENTTTIVKTVEQWAGVEVRGRSAGA
ncbi:MAG: NAD(P)-dependent oxidoreductase [Comamonadaceae bacterium]|nr:MAG: NAD(P)-dependent oxidoreductase [Comamonadaceae bacterium]